ncbi:ATP-binding protein [Cupriavidus necator]|uniref:ATP-binding protein n=1 Tax=Cupriavidus necator TaxID=106590 RepID=UPI003F734F9C
MIPLDLLVREAVQNSLDAALKRANSEVSVDVTIRPHGTEVVASLFESGIDKEVLFRLFPEGGRMLEIRDKGTEGLTGPIRLEDVGPGQARGNLLKLVYEVGRTRSDETSGGSWGLGKTCYFRVGVGLVIYYSRILSNDGFEERLVACLVENESDDCRLQRNSATGIAWWGGEKGTPITESARIAALLRSIGVQPYAGEDTGTAIIIPFLKPNLIPLQEEVSSDEPDDNARREPLPWWFRDYESYACVALQRWFCVRIDNPQFRGGPALAVSVNGQRLQTERMQPVFQVLQALYNRLDPETPRGREDFLDKCSVGSTALLNKSIDLNRVFRAGTSAGRITAVRLTPEQLKMVEPENMPDPYRCIFSPQEQAQRDRPLVAFMRGPGMVIRWDNSNDPKGWGGSVLLPAGEGYLIGLFVPEKDRELKEDVRTKLRNPDQTLEAYLRSCERADHHQWVDHVGLTIISRIRGKAGNAIETFNAPVAAKPRGISLRAARNLADRLLPAGFGQDGRVAPVPPARPDRGDSPRRHNGRVHSFPDLDVTKVRYGENEMHICWRLQWGKGQASRQIALGVDSESGVISYDKWIEEGLGPFPLTIENAAITDELSSHVTDILNIDRTLLVVRPWRSDMDGATINGELTIRMPGRLAGNLRPVLHAAAVQTPEVPA